MLRKRLRKQTRCSERLKKILNYYVKSRQVNDDYERLFDLPISDKLKESLPPGPLQFVLSKEGTECFKTSMIADLADIHANNKIGMPSYIKQSYGSTVSYKKNSSGNEFQFPDKRYQGSSNYNRRSQSKGNSPERKSYEKQDQKQVGWRTSKNTSMTGLSKPRGFSSGYSRTNDDGKRCHQCGSDQHLVRDCDKAKGNQNTQGTRLMYQRSSINKIQVTPTYDVSEETETKIVMKCGGNLKPNHQEIMPEQIVVKQTVKKEDSNALKKIQLKHVTVEIRGKETEKESIVKVNALSDSGAEIPVISEELIEGMNLEQVGEVSIQLRCSRRSNSS